MLWPAHASALRALADPATETVITTSRDILDGDTQSIASLNADPGADGRISLREALMAAEATPDGSDLRISFAIPALDPNYDPSTQTWRIKLSAGPGGAWDALLPPLARGHVTIDGSTQPGNGGAGIIIDGFDVYGDEGTMVGFRITSEANVLRGLALVNFWDTAIVITGPAATGNLVAACSIGVSLQGPGEFFSFVGVEVRGGATGNAIGAPAAGNIIVGAGEKGVLLTGTGTKNNTVAANWIGLTLDGAPLGNVIGVLISNHASANAVGAPGAGNVISGNESGVYIDDASQNSVIGNLIGLDPTGVAPRSNSNGGVYIVNGARENRVGGPGAGERNIISANGAQGVYVAGQGSDKNVSQGNYIGLDAAGAYPLGNLRQGVIVSYDADSNTVGGTGAGEGNVIAYNGLGGIRIDSESNLVAGNMIGVAADGVTSVGNQNHGIRVGGDSNIIGPNNIIAHNQASGIIVTGSRTTIVANRLTSNAISGVCVTGAYTQVVGNEIVGNGASDLASLECVIKSGIFITGTATLVGNNIVRDNQESGIAVYEGRGNTITANSITGNTPDGITLRDGGNGLIDPPTLAAVEPDRVSGVACAACRVEVFIDMGDQGGELIGTTTADGDGQFSLALTRLITNTNVTATHTDALGNTSQFALAKGVRAAGRLYFIDLPFVSLGPTPDPATAP
jgi:parallel beta-helix repeat protein